MPEGMTSPEIPLVVRDLVKSFGTVSAVNGVSFEVQRGMVFCLLGQNGAGKTTTLRMTQGLREPTSGTVRLFGEDPRKASRAVRSRIGVLPQTFSAFELLTVRENLEYLCEVFEVRPDLDALLESLGLGPYADKRYSTLSGGTRRRVGIVSALVNDPELIFLDEPTAGVDPASRRQLWALIERLRREGRSIVLTTHYMDEAERLSDEVAILHGGRIVAQGPPSRVKLEHGGPTTVRVTGLQDPLPTTLAARAVEDEDAVTISLEDAQEAPLVVAEIVKAGVRYRELSIREPSLDDAFIRLVARRDA